MKYSFTALLIFTIVILFGINKVYAQEITAEPSPTPTIIQYDLAFPGILPDNFLYKLKIIRDRLQLLVTSDPKKRIDLLLQMADKGILASAILIDKNEWKLAKETALKAENNMTLLTPELSNLEDPIDQKFVKNLRTASQKHQEILAKLEQRAPEGDRTVFAQVINFSKRNESEIDKYIEQ